MELDGFNEFVDILNNAAKKLQDEGEAVVNRSGNKVLRKVKKLTPVASTDGGTLRRNWTFEKSSNFEGVIQNPTEYAPHVEYGHRTMLGFGGKSQNPKYKYVPKPGGIKMVPGRFMLRRSIDSVSKTFFKDVEALINNIFE